MGQKVNPIGFRLGVKKNWKANWFASKKDFEKFLHQDIAMRKYLDKKLDNAGVADVRIERSANQVILTISTSRPGVIIGRSGAGVEELKKEVEKITKQEVKINIQEIGEAESNSSLVAQAVAAQIEKRISYRRAVKQAIDRAQKAKIKGIKIKVSGRLGGVEMARKEKFSQGSMPLHTLKAEIDYAYKLAHTTYGVIGVKVWIFK